MSAESIEDIMLEQSTWCEGWRKSPLWLRLIGGPRQYYAEKRQTYRMKWGELTFGWSGVAFKFGGYETAHLNMAFGLGQVFIRLPFLDKAFCEGTNSIESPSYGFSTFGASLHLNWGRRCKIIDPPWQRRYLWREFLSAEGEWVSHDLLAREYKPGEGVEPYKMEFPYHYMLEDGEVQHVTATVTRERGWIVCLWFGDSGRFKKAPVSDFLRSLQKRLVEPRQYIEVAFSDEVGSRRGSWKGGCIGCSYEMKAGETPQRTLQRMQGERKFR